MKLGPLTISDEQKGYTAPFKKSACETALKNKGKYITSMSLSRMNYKQLPDGIRVCWKDVKYCAAIKAQDECKDMLDIIHCMCPSLD